MAETEAQLALMFSFYEGLQRKGPGSEKSTLMALSLLDGLPSTKVQVLDLGCGAGAASLVLAKAIDCRLTAVDIYEPFLKELEASANTVGLRDRIKPVQADMSDPPFPEHAYDLLWSEGALYLLGFEEGLKCWRRFLRLGGFVAVTELTWLSENPPLKAVDFWKSEYPAITTINDNLAKMHSAGFDPVGHFILPAEDWQNYYGPLQAQLVAFRTKHRGNADALALAESLQREIDLWNECGSSYGYVFYLGRVS